MTDYDELLIGVVTIGWYAGHSPDDATRCQRPAVVLQLLLLMMMMLMMLFAVIFDIARDSVDVRWLGLR